MDGLRAYKKLRTKKGAESQEHKRLLKVQMGEIAGAMDEQSVEKHLVPVFVDSRYVCTHTHHNVITSTST
jgi:hypothetical protein